MTEKVKELMKSAGTDTSGKWMSVDNIERFAELLVEECCNILSKETIRHDGYGYNQHALYQKIKEHFGVKE